MFNADMLFAHSYMTKNMKIRQNIIYIICYLCPCMCLMRVIYVVYWLKFHTINTRFDLCLKKRTTVFYFENRKRPEAAGSARPCWVTWRQGRVSLSGGWLPFPCFFSAFWNLLIFETVTPTNCSNSRAFEWSWLARSWRPSHSPQRPFSALLAG